MEKFSASPFQKEFSTEYQYATIVKNQNKIEAFNINDYESTLGECCWNLKKLEKLGVIS